MDSHSRSWPGHAPFSPGGKINEETHLYSSCAPINQRAEVSGFGGMDQPGCRTALLWTHARPISLPALTGWLANRETRPRLWHSRL